MSISIQRTSSISPQDLGRVLHWWNTEFPTAFQKDANQFEDWMNSLQNHLHYQLYIDDVFSAWAMTFDRDEERWFSILVPHQNHGIGLGKTLISELQSNESPICGWVITETELKTQDGRVYRGPLEFYKKLNFRETDIRVEFTPTVHPVKIVFP